MKTKTKAATTDRRAVSHALRESILADGSTAYSLGKRAGVDPGMIQRFLDGERGLSLATIDRLALALGLRLVEGARGRGRPAKPVRPTPAEVGSLADADIEPDPCQLAEETAPSPDAPETPGPSNTDSEPCPLAEVPETPALLGNVGRLDPPTALAESPADLTKPEIPAAPVNPFLALIGRNQSLSLPNQT